MWRWLYFWSTKIFSGKTCNSKFEIIALLFLLSKTFISITCINIVGIAKYTDVQLISNHVVIFISSGRPVGSYWKYFTCTVRRAARFVLCRLQRCREAGAANPGLRAPPHGKVGEGHRRGVLFFRSGLRAQSRGTYQERLLTRFIQNINDSK